MRVTGSARLILLSLALPVLPALTACRTEEQPGIRLEVWLPEASGLEAGDPVTQDGVRIGRVESVADGRIDVRIDGEHAARLPRTSTFVVTGSDREPELELHVLDPDGEPVRDGDVIEGTGSRIEVALRRGAREVGEAIETVRESDLAGRVERAAAELRREVESIDWKGLGRDAEARVREVGREIEQLGKEGTDAARRSYEKLKPEVEALARKLEEMGKSEQARELRAKAERAWQRVREEIDLEARPATSPTPTP